MLAQLTIRSQKKTTTNEELHKKVGMKLNYYMKHKPSAWIVSKVIWRFDQNVLWTWNNFKGLVKLGRKFWPSFETTNWVIEGLKNGRCER
jgi:hypothetical protein